MGLNRPVFCHFLSIKIAQKSLKMVKSPKFFGTCGGQKGARYARQPKMATPPCTITPVTPLVAVTVPGVNQPTTPARCKLHTEADGTQCFYTCLADQYVSSPLI